MKILNRYKFISISVFAGLFLSSLLSFGQAPPPAPVEVVQVSEKEIRKPVSIVGSAEPMTDSIIASEISGLIESFPVKEGDYVKKGELLASFRSTTLELKLKEAKAAKREARARHELARKNMKRIEELYDKGVASLQQLQDAESEQDALLARITQMDAQIDTDQYNLDRSQITAPYDGYITEEFTEVGEWVNEGGPIVELINIESSDITVDVPERYISKVNVGESAEVKFDAYPGQGFPGKIISIVPKAEQQARTFPVKVRVKNQDGLIKSGMVARVTFLIGEPSKTKFVPKDAIVKQNNANFIYLVQDGLAVPTPVNTGFAYNEFIEVIGPVESGQPVVVRGNERLRPNQPVEIVNPEKETLKN